MLTSIHYPIQDGYIGMRNKIVSLSFNITGDWAPVKSWYACKYNGGSRQITPKQAVRLLKSKQELRNPTVFTDENVLIYLDKEKNVVRLEHSGDA